MCWALSLVPKQCSITVKSHLYHRRSLLIQSCMQEGMERLFADAVSCKRLEWYALCNCSVSWNQPQWVSQSKHTSQCAECSGSIRMLWLFLRRCFLSLLVLQVLTLELPLWGIAVMLGWLWMVPRARASLWDLDSLWHNTCERHCRGEGFYIDSLGDVSEDRVMVLRHGEGKLFTLCWPGTREERHE